MEEKKIKTRIKEKFQKNKQIIGKQIIDFFDWVKGAELVSLEKCDTSEDPV